MTTLSRHLLAGCRPEPLGSYLKALGLLRILGEQADPDAAGQWSGDEFVVHSGLDRDALLRFLLDDYAPTPLVSPWNGGSGFYEKDKKARTALECIRDSDHPRFADYRATLAVAERLVGQAEAEGWSLKDTKHKEHKERFIQRCRAWFPDRSIAWLDAAVVLTDQGLSFPTLLGRTGGNLGRLELSANFMGALTLALCLQSGRGAPSREDSHAWLAAALFRESSPGIDTVRVGQFDPGGAGSPTSSAFGAEDSPVNPWDVVLLMEGALVFASAAARRMGIETGSSGGAAAMPFMVASSPVGYPSSASDENAKGEVWAPLWSRPATAAEVTSLVGEGRSTWRRRQARNGLDFARAAASLGVDRGITAFARHAVVERHGQSPLAVPAGRFQVTPRPQVPLLHQLDPWLDRIRRVRDRPAGVDSALRRVDATIFEVAARGGTSRLQDVLIAVADLEGSIARSGRLRERGLSPVQGLRAEEWLPLLVGDRPDDEDEVVLAAALASQRDRDGASLRFLLTPVRLAPTSAASGRKPARRVDFSDAPPPVTGLGYGHIRDVLADALVARALQVQARNQRGDVDGQSDANTVASRDSDQVGIRVGYDRALSAPATAVAALLDGAIDETRLSRLLAATLLLSWPDKEAALSRELLGQPGGAEVAHLASPSFALLAPFFHWRPIGLGDQGDPFWPLIQPSWPSRLMAGQIPEVCGEAHQRLRMAGLRPAVRTVLDQRPQGHGARLAAALLVPLHRRDAWRLLRRVAPPPLTDPDDAADLDTEISAPTIPESKEGT